MRNARSAAHVPRIGHAGHPFAGCHAANLQSYVTLVEQLLQ